MGVSHGINRLEFQSKSPVQIVFVLLMVVMLSVLVKNMSAETTHVSALTEEITRERFH